MSAPDEGGPQDPVRRKLRPGAPSTGRHVESDVPRYDWIEVPPELEGIDPETQKPYIEGMYPGHRHTPLCGSRDRVVVGVDRSGASKAALAWAAEEARLRHTHLQVVHATTDAEDPTEQLTDVLTEVVPTLHIDIDSVPSSAAETLVAAAHGAALLAVGNHVRANPDEAAKSVARRAAAFATCPVAFVRAGARLGLPPHNGRSSDPGARNRIVVGVDDSFTARDALWFAANEAAFRSGGDEQGGDREIELLVVNVAPPSLAREAGPVAGPAGDLLEYLTAELLNDDRLTAGGTQVWVTTDAHVAAPRDSRHRHEVPAGERPHFPRPDDPLGARERPPFPADDLAAEGLVDSEGQAAVNLRPVTPAEVLVELSHEADLLVLGARGYGESSPALHQSIVQDCLTHSDCPVVVTPAAREDTNRGVRRAVIALEQMWERQEPPRL